MRKIIIVCNDTYGLDVYMIIEAINNAALKKNPSASDLLCVEGFISNRKNPFGDIIPPKPVLGFVDNYIAEPGDVSFVMAIRNPNHKEAAVKALKSRGARFETLVAPWVLLPFNYEAGEGCIIANYNCKQNSKFGDFVIMDTAMCETVEVGDYSTLCPFVNMTSAAIGKRVYVGSHAVIMSHLQVGDDSYIYPGSIVVKNVKPGSAVAGVPATGAAAKKWKENKQEQ